MSVGSWSWWLGDVTPPKYLVGTYYTPVAQIDRGVGVIPQSLTNKSDRLYKLTSRR